MKYGRIEPGRVLVTGTFKQSAKQGLSYCTFETTAVVHARPRLQLRLFIFAGGGLTVNETGPVDLPGMQ